MTLGQNRYPPLQSMKLGAGGSSYGLAAAVGRPFDEEVLLLTTTSSTTARSYLVVIAVESVGSYLEHHPTPCDDIII